MYDNKQELMSRIALGESTHFELKEVRFSRGRVSGPSSANLADELAAFANSRGGVCLLGVNDQREVVGVLPNRIDRVMGFVRHICTELVDPVLNAIVDSIWLPNASGRDVPVIKIEIRKSLWVHRSPSGYLHRVVDEKRAISPQQLARLFQSRSQTRIIRFDAEAVSTATMDALAPNLWRRFCTPRTRNDRDAFLSKLCMAGEDDNGVLRPTVAGILMGTTDPRRWLPNAFVQAVAYRGTRIQTRNNQSYQLDASDIVGPLDAQVEQACRFVSRNMKVAAIKDVGRLDLPQFDMAAVFEAIVNAVAHRDYSIYGSKIRLRLFSDRLELYSPGEIPSAHDPGKLLYTQFTRNEVISSLLARCRAPDDIPGLTTARRTLMDRRGEGMRIIVENSLAVSGRKPEYKMAGASEFLVTIYGAPTEWFEQDPPAAPAG